MNANHNDPELSPLDQWISAVHLTPEALSHYSQEFLNHPLKIVQIRQFLQEDKAKRIEHFLTMDVKYEEVYALFTLSQSMDGELNYKVSKEEWLSAPDENRFYKYGRYYGYKPGDALTSNMPVFHRFREVVASNSWVRFLQRITTKELATMTGLAASSMVAGDFLRSHSDQRDNRQIGFILYLNSHWRREFGGDLVIKGYDGNYTRFSPEYNSLIVFDIWEHDSHYVDTILADAKSERRLTITGWVNTPTK